MFTSPSGEELFKEWVERYVFTISHVPGDSHSTAVNEGLRSFVLGLKLDIESEKDPDADDNDLFNEPRIY